MIKEIVDLGSGNSYQEAIVIEVGSIVHKRMPFPKFFKEINKSLGQSLSLVHNVEELKELVDGAYTIVELYKTETPLSVEWRAEWLRKARELVG